MDKVCLNCGLVFSTNNKNRKYCSSKCAYSSRTIHKCKECIVCGKIFKPQNSSTKFCSKECYNSIHRVTYANDKNCLNCNKSFHPKDKTKKFCSLSCAYEYRTKIKEHGFCLLCGKEFVKTYQNKKYCSRECSYKSQIKNGIIKCGICGKEFKAKDSLTKYCSRECVFKSFTTDKHKERLRELALSRIKEKGYMWSCQSENTKKSYKTISKINLRYKKILEDLGYKVELEFPILGYLYDIKIDNTLIEINPSPFHNSTWNPLTKPKDKNYHLNKYKCAIDNGYKCIMVFDWVSDEDLIEYIKEGIIYKGEPNLHRYNIKTKEHIIDKNLNRDEMILKGFVEIYDCGNLYYITK